MVLTVLLFLGIVLGTVSSAELVRGKCRRMLRSPRATARPARPAVATRVVTH